MSEPKTKPTDASVEEFLDAAATQRRRKEGHRLAAIFTEVTGVEPVTWGPSMVGYGSFLYVSPANPRAIAPTCSVATAPPRDATRARSAPTAPWSPC